MLRRRTPEEREAFLQGFEAGVDAALNTVRRLNFSEVASRAEEQVSVTLKLIRDTPPDTQVLK